MPNLFDLSGRIAVVTGGYGVIGTVLTDGLAAAGARVAVLGLEQDNADARAAKLREKWGIESFGIELNVLDEAKVRAARDKVLARWGRVDILVNAAGGNVGRSRNDDRPIFDVPSDATEEVLRLNLHGTVYPSLIFGEVMARQGKGCILNISSMSATQALSGTMGYSLAKSGIDSFTRWLATDLARRYGDGIRVNAIAPGFFLSAQNRDVLIKPDGSFTPRYQTIVAKTPMGRFGQPEELIGAVQYLCSDAASFVTGVIIPIDGGFSAFTGV